MGELPILLWNQHQSFVYISKDIWIFLYTLGFNVILLYLFCCSKCFSFGHWEIFQLALLSFWRAPVIVCLYMFFKEPSQFLAPQDDPGSPCIYKVPAPAQELVTSLRSPHSSYWIMVLETKIWAQGVVIVTGISLLIGPIS